MDDILICGGSNLVGPYIISQFINNGCNVTVMSRGNKEIPYRDAISHVKADALRDISCMKEAFSNRHFNAVVDCIALCPESVDNILSCVETDRYIQVSSMGVYPFREGVIKEDEFDPYGFAIKETNSGDDYGTRKRNAEAIAYQKWNKYNPVVIRPGYVVDSVKMDHTANVRLWEIVNWVKNGIPINPCYIDYNCTFTNVIDEAELVYFLYKNKDFSAPINIVSRGSITVAEMISYIESRVDKKAIYSNDGRIHGFLGGKQISGERYEGLVGNAQKTFEWLFSVLDFFCAEDIEFNCTWEQVRKEMDQFWKPQG